MTDSKRIKRLCIISPGYPTERYPMFPFVDQLVCAFSTNGIECTVISPQSILKTYKEKEYGRPIYWKRIYEDITIGVYQPKYVSFSNVKIHGNLLSDISFEKKVIHTFGKLHKVQKFDAIYGHFWNCGLIASKIAKIFNLPAYVACGESEININEFSRNLKYKNNINGVICVSTKCLNECLEKGLCDKEKAGVFPNAIDDNLFFVRNKHEMREKLGYSKEDFIVSFVGSFIDRKGSNRLSRAIDSLANVKSIFIGSGPEEPTCKNILFVGKLPHDRIPEYLNAADVFALPTLNEGCCNAIIEAMACGLPIISSDLPFNYDVIDESNAILVNPNNIEDIKNAIYVLQKDKKKRLQMGEMSSKKASCLTIRNRAYNIARFMESKL